MRRFVLLLPFVVLIIGSARPAPGQPVQASADRVLWELATWPGTDPVAPQTQADSGEDWFYSITRSLTDEQEQDGFVAAGYSTYAGLESTACVEVCTDNNPTGPSCSLGTIAKIDAGGGVDWFNHNGLEGTYWRVISLEDGGFLAVGHSNDRSLLGYNPPTTPVLPTLSCSPEGQADRRLMIVAKYNHAGTELWRYAYGHMADPDRHLPLVGDLAVQDRQDIAWDAVERPGGGYRVVGNAVDPHSGMNPRAFVMDLDPDGALIDQRVFGDIGYRSEFMGITRSDDDYFLVGTKYNDDYDTVPPPYGDVFVMHLGDDLMSAPVDSVLLTSSRDAQDTGYDIAIAGDGSVHVATVLDCEAGGMGQCFRSFAGGVGEAVIFRLEASDLGDFTTTSLGEVRAYDLFVRLTALSDGRVAVVSTKQLGGSINNQWDNTDAYVAILDEDATLD